MLYMVTFSFFRLIMVKTKGLTYRSNDTGWWYNYPSEKYEFVSWDDYSQLNGTIKNVPNHQPVYHFFCENWEGLGT